MTDLNLAIWLAGVVAFIIGFFVGGLAGVSASDRRQLEIEKSGVWSIKDRSYRLTLIAKDPR